MKTFGIELYKQIDIEKARQYWKITFLGHTPQLPPQRVECQLSVVIPVFGENIDRLKAELRSFEHQTLSRDRFEIIYLINNDVSDGTRAWRDTYKKNQEALSFLKKYKGFAVHVIDRSSSGKEIKECNVGKARNIALAEVSFRYFSQGRDGIIFQTDADVRLNNKRHFQQIFSAFRKDPLCFGASGGVLYELSPDTQDVKIRKAYNELFKDVVLLFRWHTLVDAYHAKKLTLPGHSRSFSGVHMVSRAIASACVGGMQELGIAEDVFFGESLEKFAKRYGGNILPMREKWYAVTAFRESLRTGSGFGKVFDRIFQEGGAYASQPEAPSFKIFAHAMLEKVVRLRTLAEVRAFISDDVLPYTFSDHDVRTFWQSVLSARGEKGRFMAYTRWREKPENKEKKILGAMYKKRYSRIRITQYQYAKLKKTVYAHEYKRVYVEYFRKHYQNFRRTR